MPTATYLELTKEAFGTQPMNGFKILAGDAIDAANYQERSRREFPASLDVL